MSLAAKLAKITVCTVVYLVVSVIAGAVASFVLDVLGVVSPDVSAAAFYALWFVLGVFCGLLNYNTAGRLAYPKSKIDWTNQSDASKTGWLVCAISLLLLVGLSVLFFPIFWRDSISDHPYVPTSMSLTLTFFTAIVIATFLAQTVFRPSPKQV